MQSRIHSTQRTLLDADLLDTFPDAEAVSVALRSLKEIAPRTGQSTPPKRGKKAA